MWLSTGAAYPRADEALPRVAPGRRPRAEEALARVAGRRAPPPRHLAARGRPARATDAARPARPPPAPQGWRPAAGGAGRANAPTHRWRRQGWRPDAPVAPHAAPPTGTLAAMRRPPLHAVALALFVALLGAATSAPAAHAAAKATPDLSAKATKPTAAAKSTKPKPAVVTRGLSTVLQDDGLFLFRPPAEVLAAAKRAKQLGIDTIRLTAGWSSLTRDVDHPVKPAGFDARDPGSYEQGRWKALDAAVRAVRAAGLQPLVDIGFWAPRWATSDPGPRARANIDPQAYADFATAVALRYSGAFTPPPEPPDAPPPVPSEDQTLLQSILQPFIPFPIPPVPPRQTRSGARRQAQAAQTSQGGAQAPGEPLPSVAQFVLWNEPNHQGLLMPQWEPDGVTPASPRVYRAMLRAGYAAVKSARRSKKVTVLIGNTSSTQGKRGAGPVAPLEFLRELACVDVKLKPRTTPDCANFQTLPGDGWAHHPYSQNERPSRVSKPPLETGDLRMADLPKLVTTLDLLVKMGRLAPANRNIYLTEFGYETQPVKGRPTINELTQAKWLTWAEYLADKLPTVRSFAQFLLRDQPPATVRVSASAARPFGQYSTGLLLANGKDKIAAKTFVAGLYAQTRSQGRVCSMAACASAPARRRSPFSASFPSTAGSASTR